MPEYTMEVLRVAQKTQKEVLLVLTDRWADWEAAYAIAEVNSTPAYVVKTAAVDLSSKTSIGGVRAEIDYRLDAYGSFEDCAMLILPGGFAWQEERHDEIAAFVRRAREAGVPVAAICGATIFLGKHGFLDRVKHSGDDLESFERQQGYGGSACYVAAQAVVDGGFVTANETAAVDFAHEIFKILEIDEPSEIEAWHGKYTNGMFPPARRTYLAG